MSAVQYTIRIAKEGQAVRLKDDMLVGQNNLYKRGDVFSVMAAGKESYTLKDMKGLELLGVLFDRVEAA